MKEIEFFGCQNTQQFDLSVFDHIDILYKDKINIPEKQKKQKKIPPTFIYNGKIEPVMKFIKQFNSFITEVFSTDQSDNIFNEMKNHKIGDIITNEKLYTYIDALHGFDMDNEFIKDHILKYNNFKLKEILIEELDLIGSVSGSLVNDYIDLFNTNKWYPPILYDEDEKMIIDGYHRFVVLERLGIKTIKAWVGI